MKRAEKIKKLITEGMSEKTLSKKSDKEIDILMERLVTTVDAINKNPELKKIADDPNKPIEVKEEEGSDDSDLIIKRIYQKIKTKKGKDCKDLIDLAKSINKGKLPKKIKDLLDELKSEKLNENIGINEWIGKLIEEKYHPFTSKKDIMEMIEDEMKEQTTVEPEIKPKTPTTKPGEKPKPKHPLQPGKSPNPKPKAGMPDFFLAKSILGTTTVEPEIKPKTPTTKPSEKPKPKHPLQPGKSPNPKPKAKA